MILSCLAIPGIRAGNVTLCKGCSISSLSSAVQQVQAHDTILIEAGNYLAINVELTRPVTLLGKGEVVLDGNNEGYILKILSDSVTISGLTFVQPGRSYTKDYAAIYAYRARHFCIENNTIQNPYFGLLLEKSKDGLVRNNLLFGQSKREDDSGNGIHMWHCSNMVVTENEVYGLRDGIYLEFVSESRVVDNYSHNNIRYGLHFMFSNHDEYTGNTFANNGAGVAVMFSKFIVMRGNSFLQNWGTASYGLLLKEIYDGEVTENVFEENTMAIFVEGSTRINYLGNHFQSNGWAVKVSGGCYANVFSKNNFVANSFDISYSGRMNDNSFQNNYWGDYSGYDLDKDGIGDVPFRPVKLFSYIVNRTPETIVLLRSLFVDIINFSERVSPVFTPDQLLDEAPAMKPY